MTTEFPMLSNRAKTGKTMVWSITVETTAAGAGLIKTRHGYEGGVMTEGEKVVREGKNIGKKNETTPYEQAIVEARSTWNKKVGAGYVAGSGGSVSGSAVAADAVSKDRSAAIDVRIPLPMLANKFQDRGHTIVYPCFTQPKFDGTRTVGLCGMPAGRPCLYSRNRKEYPHLEHIQAVLRRLPAGLVLDGELYTRDIPFQDIVGLVKKNTLKEADMASHGLIQLHVYDLVDEGLTFEERLGVLRRLFAEHGGVMGSVVQLCVTEEISSAEGVKAKFDQYVAAGYEGVMLRNKRGRYLVGHRSSDLLKYKEMMDEEYKIIGFYEGEGDEAGCVLWECALESGKTFRCRPKGTQEERRALFKRGGDFLGKMLTVQFQELTPDGVPRFPVGLAIRDYE